MVTFREFYWRAVKVYHFPEDVEIPPQKVVHKFFFPPVCRFNQIMQPPLSDIHILSFVFSHKGNCHIVGGKVREKTCTLALCLFFLPLSPFQP